MTPKKKRNLQYSDPVSNAAEKIDYLIGTGGLVPGQRLVEVDLVELLGIGRVPIREALRILAGDGVVELIPNRGARVRSYSGHQIAEMLKALVGMLCAGIDEFVRSPKYPQGMQRLEKLSTEISVKTSNLDGYGLLETMAHFQQTIFEAANNSYLIELHRRVHFHHYNRQMLNAVGFPRLAKITAVYQSATLALRARDPDRASKLFKSALNDTVVILDQPDRKKASKTSNKA